MVAFHCLELLGILIPREKIAKNKLKEGSNIGIAIIKKDTNLIDKMFGSIKAGAFRREHTNRVI